MSLETRKLVVLGIPWDVNTEGLKQYMVNYGQLEDVIVMKDRTTGRSRGFGYVTFQSAEDAQKVLVSQHILNGRALEVKIATPKEDMKRPPEKKNTRVFVARISPTVTDDMFRSHFEKYGVVTDAYMPKEQGSKTHRGIGFITFESPESVDKVMSETHELGGSTIAVDRATPKEEPGKSSDKMLPAYELLSSYINAARFGGFGMLPYGDYGGFPFPNAFGGGAGIGPGTYGASMGGGAAAGAVGITAGSHNAGNGWQKSPVSQANMAVRPTGASASAFPNLSSASLGTTAMTGTSLGKKIFIGRIPLEATVDDVRLYFSDYGPLLDVYLPKDKNKASHRGFGFVTFAEESAAERVAQRSHELCGQKLAVDRATPLNEPAKSGAFLNDVNASTNRSIGGVGGPVRGNDSSASAAGYGSLPNVYYSTLWGNYGVNALRSSDQAGKQPSRFDGRYKPY